MSFSFFIISIIKWCMILVYYCLLLFDICFFLLDGVSVQLSLNYFILKVMSYIIFELSGRVGLIHNNPILGAVRERGGKSCPDHRGGAGSGIDSTCAGRGRVNHDLVPIRPVAIPRPNHPTRVPTRPLERLVTDGYGFYFVGKITP